MIIYHQTNVAGFVGAHVRYGLNTMTQRISKTSAAASNVLISQSRGVMRMVQGRVFGRIN